MINNLVDRMQIMAYRTYNRDIATLYTMWLECLNTIQNSNDMTIIEDNIMMITLITFRMTAMTPNVPTRILEPS